MTKVEILERIAIETRNAAFVDGAFAPKATIFTILAAMEMVAEWSMEKIFMRHYTDDSLEFEGNYAIKSPSNVWGQVPTEENYRAAARAFSEEGPWPYKPLVIYGPKMEVEFEMV